MPRPTTALLAALLLSAPALADQTVRTVGMPLVEGSGQRIAQTRQLEAFDSIECKVPARLEVSIGPAQSVEVRFDDNLQNALITGLQGKTLVIDNRGSWHSEHGPEIHITVPRLEALELLGSAEGEVKGFAGGDFAASLKGSGSLQASGQVGNLLLMLKGSGDARLKELKADTAKVRVDGSGDAIVNVARTLDAVVNGSGDIRYRGNATVTQVVHGSGDISKD
jgi:hypothetical protein